MHPVEFRARPFACRVNEPWETVSLDALLEGSAISLFSKGIFHRVYRVDDAPLVLKEARWDPSVPVGDFEWQLPAHTLRDVLPQFGNALLPGREDARRQYENDYLLFAEYFGYFDETVIEDASSYPDFATLSSAQRRIRENLPEAASQLEQAYGWLPPEQLSELLASDVVRYNFLPREYLLWGEGRCTENQGRETSFILQEYVEGPTLHDVSDAMLLTSPYREHMILLCVLILLLQHERRVLPDTRPRQPLWQGQEWLRKTDNIIAGRDGLKFIDTRWLWRRGPNPITRGFIIPELLTQACLTTITSLFD